MKFKNITLFSLATLGLFLLLAATVYAQTPQQRPKNIPLPVATREISGIVKDTTDLGVPGVTVRLTSEKDTLITSTNPDGIFIVIYR